MPPSRGRSTASSAGDDQGPGLVDGLDTLRARAVRLATTSARIASTWPSRRLGAPEALPDRPPEPR